MAAGERGGYPHQLTLYEDQTVRQLAWSPDGRTILFTADRRGDEFHQLHAVPAQGGWPRPLTAAPRVQHHLAAAPWSPDGRLIAYAGNDRSPADQDVLIRDVASGEVRRVLAGEAFYFPGTWSPDGAWLTVVDARLATDTDVYLVDVARGAARHLTPHAGEVLYLPRSWAADGSGFYLLTDEGREFVGLAFYDLGAGTLRWLETPAWDVEDAAASPDGRYLAWTVNEEGSSQLHVRDLTSGQPVSVPELPAGVVSSYPGARSLWFAPSGAKLAFFLDWPRHPAEVYVLDLASGTATQVTHGFLGGIDEADLIEPELVRFPTHDGRRIPAFLYRPAGGGPCPVVLSIHGGPEAQERTEYAALYQYLLNRGIGVLAPNVRGSTGYGKTYQKLIHRDGGGDELKDLEAAAVFLRSLAWVDPDRLGVFGGSYGGFAVLSCVSRLPAYWAAAVDIVGPSNLVTLIETGPPTWRRADVATIGDPATEAEFLLSRSPVTYADRISAPLLVIQGANDPRVPRAESDQIVERLRARGVEVRYDVYEDEGHGFTKRENEDRVRRDTAEFLERHLRRA